MSREVAARLGGALQRVREAAHVIPAELARRMRVNAARVSSWESGDKTMQLTQVEAAERALGVPAGTILAEAGYVDVSSARLAIRSDPSLDPEDRRILMEIYDRIRGTGQPDANGMPDDGERTPEAL